MKKLGLFLVCIAFHVNAWALGGYATLSGDNKNVADLIKDKLAVSEEDAYQIFDGYLKEYLNTKNWQYTIFHNDSPSSSKISKSANKTIYINFATDNRFVNVSIVKFSAEKQVLIHAIETLPRASQLAIDKYNSLKSDSAYSVDADTAEFSSFTKTGYAKRVKVMVNSGVGGIQYVDLFTYDLRK